MIEDKNTQVFVPPLSEHEYYTVKFLEDYIYDIFAQKIDKNLSPLCMLKFMICGELHTKNSRMREQLRKILYDAKDVYKFYHNHYKDLLKIIRDEWVEKYELQDPP